MMGFSPHMKRNELLRMKKTATAVEFSQWVQDNLLDKGHEVEEATRPYAETVVGDDLYKVTGRVVYEGLALLASFDGLTMDETTPWECKLWNAELVRAVEGGEIPPANWPQLEHQLLVCGGRKMLFTVSLDGTEENTRKLWYVSDPKRREQLIAGWKQFDIDLEAYVPVEVTPTPVAAPVKTLPALNWKLDGLKLTSNLPVFKAAAAKLVDDSKKELKTDQDFADAEAMVKAFQTAEDKIALVKEQVIGEIHDVAQFTRDLGEIGELIRQARLNREKQVTARKAGIRIEIVDKAKVAFAAHLASLNERLGKPFMPPVASDFAGVMKNKRTIASLQDAVDTEMARVKIESNAIADRIQINLKTIDDQASEFKFLFADTATIVQKSAEDLNTLVQHRISQHKAETKAKEDAERERIRAEEKAKLEQEEAERKRKEEAERLRLEREEQARVEAEAKKRREDEERALTEAAERTKAEEKRLADLAAEAASKGGAATGATTAAAAPGTQTYDMPQPAASKAAPAPSPVTLGQVLTSAAPGKVAAAVLGRDELRDMISAVLDDMVDEELVVALDAINKIRQARPHLKAVAGG